MRKHKKKKYVHAGGYVAAVEVDVIEDDTGWSPYLRVDEANILDEVREALNSGDLDRAAKHGKVYEMRPVKS